MYLVKMYMCSWGYLISQLAIIIHGSKKCHVFIWSSAQSYLTFRFGGRPFCSSDFVFHGNIMNEGVSLWWGEVWLRLLSKVELDGTVLHQDVREQSTVRQLILGRPESNAQPHSILGVAHLNLITIIKVLHRQNNTTSISKLQPLMIWNYFVTYQSR